MSAGVNYDPAVFPSKEEALDFALSDSDPGDTLTVCRGEWGSCPDGQVCPMCARVTVTEGMTLGELLSMVGVHRV